MNSRGFWMMFGLVFSATLAVVIGQRLSAEAMAVMMGVVAGVVASIPTSLIVAWFALRASSAHNVAVASPSRTSVPAEPRIVVLAQPPQQAPAYQHYAGFAPASYDGRSQPIDTSAPASIMPPRNFTMIGGETGDDVYEPTPVVQQEVAWQR